MIKQYNDQEKLIFNYTNRVREKNGLEKLVWDDDLAEIAREHSNDMIERNYFDHVNPSGETPTKRALRHRCVLKKELGNGYYTEGIGENLSMMPAGNVKDFGYVEDKSDSLAKAHVVSWLNSPGHRKNLLEPSYNRIGVGISFNGTHYYATQNFW